MKIREWKKGKYHFSSILQYLILNSRVTQNSLSLAAASEGISPARVAMTLAAAKQWRASMKRVCITEKYSG